MTTKAPDQQSDTTSLSAQYIAAALKGVPRRDSNDVRRELESLIADQIEARIELGEDREAAEREVITGLGDPLALAASFIDRPLQLLSGKYYLMWARLTRALLTFIPGLVAIGVMIEGARSSRSLTLVILDALGTSVTVAVHIVFWTALAFIILQRRGDDIGETWKLSDLPQPAASGSLRGRAVGESIVALLIAAALIWDYYLGLVWLGGQPIHFFHERFWPWAGILIVGTALVQAVITHLAATVGRWTVVPASLYTALTIIGLATMVWYSAGKPVFSEALMSGLSEVDFRTWVDMPNALATGFQVAVGVVIVISVWELVTIWRKVGRAA